MNKKLLIILSALLLGVGVMNAEIKKIQYEYECTEYVKPFMVSLFYNIDTEMLTAEVSSPSKGYYSSYWLKNTFVIVPETIEYDGDTYTVIGIESRAFASCDYIQLIETPATLEYIGEEAFYQCPRLHYAEFMNSPLLTTIKPWTFAKCSELSFVEFPESLTSIGEYAFCGAMEGSDDFWNELWMFMPATPPTLGESAFEEVNEESLHIIAPCDEGSLEAYKAAEGWKDYADYIMYHPVSRQYTLTVEQKDHGTVTDPETTCDLPLVATPDEGYKFVEWWDGTTENPHIDFSLFKDTVVWAVFEPIMYAWSYESSDEAKGTVSTTFTEASYQHGTEITITAEPKAGCKFVKWNNGSTENPLVFNITEDTYVRAIFADENAEVKTVEVSSSIAKILLKLPFVELVDIYTLRIYYDFWRTHLLCTVYFDKDGKKLTIEYAAPRRTPSAVEEEAFTFELTDLDPGTEYFYVMEGHDAEGRLMDTYEGSASTLDTPTAIDELTERPAAQKTLLNGRLIIITNDGKRFDATGVQM